MHLSRFGDQHRADVFLALEEMPPVGRLCTDETRKGEGVVRICEHQEIFLGAAHHFNFQESS